MATSKNDPTGNLKPSRYNRRLRAGQITLYHNTLYGSLLAVSSADRENVDAILKGRYETVGSWRAAMPHLIRVLTEHEFLVPRERDELEVCRALFMRGQSHYPNLTLSFILGYDCNFSCGYCFQRLARRQRGTASVLSESHFEALIRFIEPQLSDVKKLDVSWMGGEPLLFLDRLLRFGERLKALAAAKEIAFENLLITNGYHLTEDAIDRLLALPNLKMQITIDGPPKVHDRRRPHMTGAGTFDLILKNVSRCLRRGIETHIRINVDAENAGEMPALIQLLEQTELAHQRDLVHFARTGWEVLPTDPPDIKGFRTFTRMERAFFSSERRSSCVKLPILSRTTGCPGLGHSEYLIDPEGHIFKCPRYTHDPAFAVGQVEGCQVSLNANHELWQAWTPFEQTKCRQCSLLPLCMGGCPFTAIYGGQQSTCGETRYYYSTRMLMQYRALRPAITG
jgi:uncharacterized protein